MIKIVLFIFVINWLLNELDFISKYLPIWYCFKCTTFWISLILLLTTLPILDSLIIAGGLSFLTTLYDRGV